MCYFMIKTIQTPKRRSEWGYVRQNYKLKIFLPNNMQF